MPNHHTYYKFSCAPEEELYIFEEIINPRWLSLPLIGRGILDFFAGNIACKIGHRCSSRDHQSDSMSNMAALVSDFLKILWHYFIWRYQTCQRCSTRGSEEVLLLIGVIRNSTWSLWLLIDRNMFYFFSKMCQYGIQCPFSMNKISLQQYRLIRKTINSYHYLIGIFLTIKFEQRK